MSGRAILAAALAEALPAWQIVSDARALDSVRKPGAAVLWTSKRQRLASRGQDWWLDDVVLWVLTATTKPADLEDDLDALLLEVTAALEELDAFAWETAERGTLVETFDGWRLTVQCVFHIDPAQPVQP